MPFPFYRLEYDRKDVQSVLNLNTHQGTVQCSLCCTVDEHTARCCAHRQEVCLLLHLPSLRFPLLPLRPLLKHSTCFMLSYIKTTNTDIGIRDAWYSWKLHLSLYYSLILFNFDWWHIVHLHIDS